jgi:prepilin-type processing-associated H-X9-DG protein
LSYSFQNPYANVSAVDRGWHFDNKLGAEYAIAADMNPGTVGKDQNVLAPSVTSPVNHMRRGNSPNHGRDGQNILFGDGHVAWESNPFVGVNRDNIYTTADGRVVASPVDGNDSVLLPTDD